MKKWQRIGCVIVVGLVAVAALTVVINRVVYNVWAERVIETYYAIKENAAGGKQPVRFRTCPDEAVVSNDGHVFLLFHPPLAAWPTRWPRGPFDDESYVISIQPGRDHGPPVVQIGNGSE
jgi:hypothetical protein